MTEHGPDKLDRFMDALIVSLAWRYDGCVDATPDSILLAVLNAVYDARKAVAEESSSNTGANK